MLPLSFALMRHCTCTSCLVNRSGCKGRQFLKFLPSSVVSLSACSENLTNEIGYFFSPSYPGNLPDDTFCKWHITVQKNHIIRLEFQEFLLTNHPTCERCFLQIFDGRDLSATAIGKFCGYMHPPVVISSSSHFTIVFRCLEGLRMTRFKAFYHSIRSMLYLNNFKFWKYIDLFYMQKPQLNGIKSSGIKR